MKKVIIILGTILLGVWIVSCIFMSDTGLKGSAEKIQNESNLKIQKIINDY